MWNIKYVTAYFSKGRLFVDCVLKVVALPEDRSRHI